MRPLPTWPEPVGTRSTCDPDIVAFTALVSWKGSPPPPKRATPQAPVEAKPEAQLMTGALVLAACEVVLVLVRGSEVVDAGALEEAVDVPEDELNAVGSEITL